MGFLSRFFGASKKSKNPLDELPPLYGGDASSPSTPVIVNCASMNSANIFIDHFIKEKHGEQERTGERVEYFVNEDGIPEYSVRAVAITLTDGSSRKYYFDISRPMNVAKKLMKPLFDQIEQKQSKPEPRIASASVVAHMLDPNTGYTRHQMVVGEQIDEETVEKFAVEGNIYMLVAYEKGIPRHIICKREMWEQQKATFDAIDNTGKKATKQALDELKKRDRK